MDRRFIRRAMRTQRRVLSASQRTQYAFDLLRNLRTQVWYLRAQCIAAYLSSDGEINLAPVMLDARNRNKVTTLPRVGEQRGKMQFIPWQPGAPLVENRYAILEPPAGKVRPLFAHSIILMPLVAFDAQGNRIGMGGGYYDRLLNSAALKGQRPLLVGVGYDFQELESIEPESWDVPLDAVVTNREVIGISGRLQAPAEFSD